MISYLADERRVIQWIRHLAAETPVFFPMPHGKVNFRFERVDEASELQFARYRPTIIAPNSFLTPTKEEIFKYQRVGPGRYELTPAVETTFQILAGVRPCDLKAIKLMDDVFADGERDPYYFQRRTNTSLIGYACPAPCDEMAYCESAGSLDWRDGVDVMLTPVGDRMLIQAYTERGEALTASGDFDPCDDPDAELQRHLDERPKPFGRQLHAPVDELPAILERHWDSPLWDQHVERCFSCGTCNLVCPTCYCFDVKDVSALDGSSGSRTRQWDACMLTTFATVAGGHNFRADPAARQRHRVKRKFQYLNERYDSGAFCVGCARCGRQCTTGIDIFDIVNDIVDHDRAAAGGAS
ncbi:MAG: 4Fe-4S dicluster domain-containing protein [Deltaproteobacteria bacterium]|nr:4Fe-4S dicluster domain-containing protein [Deltaproteobacteria bacterium]